MIVRPCPAPLTLTALPPKFTASTYTPHLSRSVSPDSASAAASVMAPGPGSTQMVSPWCSPSAHDTEALPSIVSAASPATHSRALILMMLVPPSARGGTRALSTAWCSLSRAAG
jgi:hypothetical protein